MRRRSRVLAALLLAIGACGTAPLCAATITIVVLDAPGEGFNDPTVAIPEGGNLGVTLGQQRLNVFRAAAAVWGANLQSNIEIKVGAQFNPLFCEQTFAVLGTAGPTSIDRDFAGAPLANTWFPIALAESLANTNRNSANNEINATFNSSIDNGCFGNPPNQRRWWYGIDRSLPPAPNTVTLLRTVLHELAHGLGFLTFVCVTPGGCTDTVQGGLVDGRNDAWVPRLRDVSTGLDWSAMNNAQRAASMANDPNLVWNGPLVTAAIPLFAPTGAGVNGSGASARMRMHAPNPVVNGSSVSHFTSAANNPELLMKPSRMEGLFDETDFTAALLRDIGWPVALFANGFE